MRLAAHGTWAELVTDDKAALKEQLEAVTGERITALEAVEPDRAKDREAGLEGGRSEDRGIGESASRDRDRSSGPEIEPGPGGRSVDRDLGIWTDGRSRAASAAGDVSET
ncbi:MAG: hypothetical protein OXH79_14350 [Boseongicola sp.]|nr:hypothetical protein [Boseongicola sp.]